MRIWARLVLFMGRCDGTPEIALPLDDADESRRYRFGRLRVKESSP